MLPIRTAPGTYLDADDISLVIHMTPRREQDPPSFGTRRVGFGEDERDPSQPEEGGRKGPRGRRVLGPGLPEEEDGLGVKKGGSWSDDESVWCLLRRFMRLFWMESYL